MDISRNGGEVAFRTAFSDAFDLVQVLCGLSSVEGRNSPVDFRLAALQEKGHPDIWHMDQVLAFSTDECSPMVINGEDIGGNHGQPCGLRVHAPGHGKDVRDVGSLWRDDDGMHFTLLRVESADTLFFLSENTGPSITAYAFAAQAKGTLHYVENGLHDTDVIPKRQQGGVQLTPAIRHTRREAVCLKDGCWQEIGGWMENCDRAEIREEYEIVNPATVARAIRDGRPEGGYTVQPTLAAGEAMFLHRMTYHVEDDGTILCDFDHQLLQDVHMPYYLGIMHQQKCDLWGGGIWRYIPKLLPVEGKGMRVDFSHPVRTAADTLPDYVPLTRTFWAVPDAPPDRQIDFIRRADGTDGVGFASGFLPLHDGVPAKRAAQITEAAMLVKSCKTYPCFAGGISEVRHPHRESTDGAMHFPTLRGIAYKKYFLPSAPGTSLYTVPQGDSTYVFMDFFADEAQQLHVAKTAQQSATLLEASVPVEMTENGIFARANAGYACFRLDPLNQKGC